jgi:protease I
MSVAGKKIAILVENYFEQVEFEAPLDQLKAAGAVVTVVGATQKDLHGMQHTKMGDSFTADKLLDDIEFDDYDALVLPGGVVNADKLRMHDRAREWVVRFTDEGKLVAAICHAPWLLVSANVVRGRELTSYYTLQDDIRNAGATWTDEEVVESDNFITSRKPDDLPAFVDAIKEWFEDE